jgi:hypothetical protein
LKSGQLRGLAIDVYEQEASLFFQDLSSTIITDDVIQRLVSFPNVIVTGHQAFFTEEAIGQIMQTTIANLMISPPAPAWGAAGRVISDAGAAVEQRAQLLADARTQVLAHALDDVLGVIGAIGLRQLPVHVEMQVKQAAQALEGGRMGLAADQLVVVHDLIDTPGSNSRTWQITAANDLQVQGFQFLGQLIGVWRSALSFSLMGSFGGGAAQHSICCIAKTCRRSIQDQLVRYHDFF